MNCCLISGQFFMSERITILQRAVTISTKSRQMPLAHSFSGRYDPCVLPVCIRGWAPEPETDNSPSEMRSGVQ